MTTHRKRSSIAAIAVAVLAVLAPARAAAAPLPAGVDVSRFNGVIVWPFVAAAGNRFAIIEASRGSGADCTVKPASCGPDPYYAANVSAARAAGLRVGAYERGFASGGTKIEARADALAEADLFIAQVGSLQRGDLLPVLDVETPFDGMTAATLRIWIQTWLARVKKRLGVHAMIYTNASSWGATGNTTLFAAKHPLWVAAYGVRRPSVPAGNWAGRGWSVWQYASDGRVPGISGKADLDRLAVGLGRISVH